MARAHSAATVVINAANQQCLGFGARGRVIGPLVIELGLDRIEEVTIEDGWLLPGEDLAFKDDLPNVEPVAQKMGERAARECNPSDAQPLALGGRDLVADALGGDFPLELGKR